MPVPSFPLPPSRRNLFATAALAAAFAPLASWALFGDRVEVWAAENVTHDTNVLRLSKNLDALPGALPRGDTIDTTHLGASLDARTGQQQFTAEYSWFRSHYRVLDYLDFDGHTANATWQWVASSALKGTLGYVDNAGLGSFANIQSPVPDYVTTRSAYATASYAATPRYRVNAAITGSESRHGSELRKVNDIDVRSGELGLSYVTPLDNSFGTVVRVETGRLPNGIDISGIPFDNAYRQYGVGATVAWTYSGHSRLDGRVEIVSRKYEQATQRNYTGPILKAAYTWAPTGKLVVVTALSRDVGPADDVQTSFVLVTGGYIRPQWNVTDKVTLQGNVEYNVWDYRGDPLLGEDLRNRVRTFGGSLAWRPYPKVLLRAGINREVRTSNTPLGDYEVDVAFIEGRAGF